LSKPALLQLWPKAKVPKKQAKQDALDVLQQAVPYNQDLPQKESRKL
jgi:hypothetical protein